MLASEEVFLEEKEQALIRQSEGVNVSSAAAFLGALVNHVGKHGEDKDMQACDRQENCFIG
jgi:hypothetical protein